MFTIWLLAAFTGNRATGINTERGKYAKRPGGIASDHCASES